MRNSTSFESPAFASRFAFCARALALLGCALLLLAVPGAARADEDEEDDGDADFSRAGFYLSLSGIYGADTFEDDLQDTLQSKLGSTARVDVEGNFGVSGVVGYRFMPNLAAELEAEWIANMDIDSSLSTIRIAEGEISPVTVTANAKAILPVDRFQPFVLVGVGVMTADVKDKGLNGFNLSNHERRTGFAMRLGAGLDFYVTEHWAADIGVDYVLPFGDVDEITYVSIGLGVKYRF